MSHEYRYRFDIDVPVQIPLAEGTSALTEIERYPDVLLHHDLHLTDGVADHLQGGTEEGVGHLYPKELDRGGLRGPEDLCGRGIGLRTQRYFCKGPDVRTDDCDCDKDAAVGDDT